MKPGLIEAYLRKLRTYLRWLGLADPRDLEELESHLYESYEDGLSRGLTSEQAQAEALARFGPPLRVAAQFEREKMTFIQILLLAVAVLGGLFSAYVDALPKFDDTGILAFGILIFTGLLGLLGARRPWLLGLSVGLWIPLRDIPLSGNYGSLLALLFALIGAYAGWGLNRLIRISPRPA